MADITQIELQNFDIEIKADGRWFHEGGEIKRIGLVKLFASVLSCDEDGRYWLTTPVEKGEIQVQDAPFIITKLRQEGSGADQCLYLSDNLDREYKLSADYPLIMRAQEKGDAKPYLSLDKGLTALIKHPIFYEMAELAISADTKTDTGKIGLLSDGQLFCLEA